MKKFFTVNLIIFWVFLSAGGCQQKTKRIITGETVVIRTETIGSEGGTITIDEEGNPLHGYSITVPEGAYDKSLSFTISYSPILNHTFGENINPVSPLITVENGGAYARKSMIVKIPVQVPDGHFAIAFFYDDKTGKLQGVPMRKSEQNLLTVATKHFTNMVASSNKKNSIDENIESGFKQGVDNWQFVNHGSYIAPGGHCFGQSLGALYYFYEKKVKAKKPSLYGLYDNKTPELQEDDALAYKLCSMLQHESAIITLGETPEDISELLSDDTEDDFDPESTFYAFAGSILVTEMPQLIDVRKKYKDGKSVGHSLIVYKCTDNALYVSDPNYPSGPGSSDRKIYFNPDTKSFAPYSSGRNAEEAQTGEILFDTIIYQGDITVFDIAPIIKQWQKFEDGTVGEGVFPQYTVMVEEKVPDGTVEYVELVNNYVTTNKKIKVQISAPDFDQRVTVFKATEAGEEKVGTVTGAQSIEISLLAGINSLGFHVEGNIEQGKDKGKYEWAGFTWVNVLYNKQTDDETGTYTCKIFIPVEGDHLLYRDKSQEWRAKVYRDGQDVTERIDWGDTSEHAGFNFYYKTYNTEPGQDEWHRIYNFNPDSSTDAMWGNVKDGMVGFREGLEPITPKNRPDQWESQIKCHFYTGYAAGKASGECFVDVIIEEKRADMSSDVEFGAF